MASSSGSPRPPPTPTINGLSFEDSPSAMSFKDSRAVGPLGVPHRTTPLSRNKQLPAVSLRLSPSCGLTHAPNHSSHAPRAQPTPSSALPTPAPRARRTYSLNSAAPGQHAPPELRPLRGTHAHAAQAHTHRPSSHSPPLAPENAVRDVAEPRPRAQSFAPIYARESAKL